MEIIIFNMDDKKIFTNIIEKSCENITKKKKKNT